VKTLLIPTKLSFILCDEKLLNIHGRNTIRELILKLGNEVFFNKKKIKIDYRSEFKVFE